MAHVQISYIERHEVPTLRFQMQLVMVYCDLKKGIPLVTLISLPIVSAKFSLKLFKQTRFQLNCIMFQNQLQPLKKKQKKNFTACNSIVLNNVVSLEYLFDLINGRR